MFMFQKRENSNMSIEKERRSKSPFDFKPDAPTKQSLQGTNLVQQNYAWVIQQPFTQDDPTIALELNLTSLPGQKKRFLDIEQFSTILLNYGGTDFPSSVALCLQQLPGFFDNLKNNTHAICYSTPANVSTVINPGGIIGYNVLYKAPPNNPVWEITGISTLTFKIKVGGDYQPLPSAQQLLVHCKITRVIF